ncbi:hypothetical protein LCGC14_2094410 [marine sediment metagenome]|uniref:Phage capsid-like C-terminal domain-containing protein n=1 Tax=marine sediment metagenome TaxID=412755 RepID=A0A0F9EC08_9ZZZZ
MDRIKELRQRKADLMDEATGLTAKEDDGSISDEERVRLDALTDEGGELDTVNVKISREERLMNERRSMEAVQDLNEDTAAEAGDRSDLIIPATPVRNDPDRFATLGEQLQAIANHDLGQGHDPRLIRAAATGSGEGVPSDGGFLVQMDFVAELTRPIWELGEIASRVRKIPISANAKGLKMNAIAETSRATGSRWGGVQVYWVGEGDAATGARPKFRQIELNLQKLMGLHYVTDELLADTTALGAVSTQAFAEEFTFVFEDAVINGNGGGQPLGYMNGGALITVNKETGQLANTLQVENIVKMWARMLPRSRRNSIWLINQEIEPQLFTMGITFGTGGQAVYMPAGGLSGSPLGTLMGRPVVPVEYTSALGAKGDIQLVDLSQYLAIDKGPMQQASSVHVRFLNDEMTFRYVWRLNGQPLDESAITRFKGADSLSAFITLQART